MSLYPTDRVTPVWIKNLESDEYIAFGSNVEGKHGAGLAKQALQWGAKWGKGIGWSGNTYAIPTRKYYGRGDIRTLELPVIQNYVSQYIVECRLFPDRTVFTTKIATGLAGLTIADIAPMFAGAVDVKNIYLPVEFWQVLVNKKLL